MNPVTISILTPSYNQGRYIERNILSVFNQNYPAFEHIIIDGGSSDSSIEVLKKYPHLKWISEKDNGQADALNKGLKIATGEIIGWINSDDYYEADIFNAVAKEFIDKNVQWIIGDITLFYEESNLRIPIKSPAITYSRLLKSPGILKQPATFFRKSILEKIGGWDAALNLVMDYDLWLRLSKVSTPKMVEKRWAYFTIQAEQKSVGRNLLKQSREIRHVLKREDAPYRYRLTAFIRNYFFFIWFHTKSTLITLGLIPSKYRRLKLIHRNNF